MPTIQNSLTNGTLGGKPGTKATRKSLTYVVTEKLSEELEEIKAMKSKFPEDPELSHLELEMSQMLEGTHPGYLKDLERIEREQGSRLSSVNLLRQCQVDSIEAGFAAETRNIHHDAESTLYTFKIGLLESVYEDKVRLETRTLMPKRGAAVEAVYETNDEFAEQKRQPVSQRTAADEDLSALYRVIGGPMTELPPRRPLPKVHHIFEQHQHASSQQPMPHTLTQPPSAQVLPSQQTLLSPMTASVATAPSSLSNVNQSFGSSSFQSFKVAMPTSASQPGAPKSHLVPIAPAFKSSTLPFIHASDPLSNFNSANGASKKRRRRSTSVMKKEMTLSATHSLSVSLSQSTANSSSQSQPQSQSQSQSHSDTLTETASLPSEAHASTS